jgi:hypothetical protein
VAVGWQDTQLGPGYPNTIPSAWSDIGTLKTGDVIRIEADGFNAEESKIAVWGWYINVWSGDGRNWVTLRGNKEPSRLLHFNPRLVQIATTVFIFIRVPSLIFRV